MPVTRIPTDARLNSNLTVGNVTYFARWTGLLVPPSAWSVPRNVANCTAIWYLYCRCRWLRVCHLLGFALFGLRYVALRRLCRWHEHGPGPGSIQPSSGSPHPSNTFPRYLPISISALGVLLTKNTSKPCSLLPTSCCPHPLSTSLSRKASIPP